MDTTTYDRVAESSEQLEDLYMQALSMSDLGHVKSNSKQALVPVQSTNTVEVADARLKQLTQHLPSLAIVFCYVFKIIQLGTHPVDALRKSRILFVIAHPDDECMFFGPTILATSASGLKNDVRLLCLSTGNAEGKGATRRQELVKSCQTLGIKSPNVSVMDIPELPDSMTVAWSEDTVSEIVKKHVSQYKIDTIITFDDYGITGHTNHIAAYKGCRHAVQTMDKKPKLYTLLSLPVARKFLSIGDLPYTLARFNANHLLHISSPGQYLTTHRAMRKHQTQLLWFRYLYVLFSRYMLINELVPQS